MGHAFAVYREHHHRLPCAGDARHDVADESLMQNFIVGLRAAFFHPFLYSSDSGIGLPALNGAAHLR